MRRSFWSFRRFFLMYSQIFLVTSVRGIGLSPTTAASCGLGFIGFMNAAFGARLAAFLAGAFLAGAFFAAGRLALAELFLAGALRAAPFFAAFLPPDFF